MSLPGHTTAAVLHAPGDLRIEEIPLRPPGPGEVLVAVDAVGICGSDMHYFATGRNGRNVLRQPTVLGHEASGVVTAAGPGAGHEPGTRVAIEPAVGCGTCPTCRSGRYNLCPDGTCFGSPPTHGVLAGHVVAPARAVHPLPDAVPLELGALIEPLAVAVWAVRRARVAPGHRVLVTGAGPIGILIAQVARAAGAAEVTVTDVHDARLARARELGASTTVNTAREDLTLTGADRLLECSAHPAALRQGILALGPAGRAVVVGQAAPAVDGVPLAHLQRWEIDLVSAFRYAHAFPTALALAAGGRVDLAPLLTGRFPLDRAADALRAPGADPHHLKVVVRPTGSPAA
ncbi:NAD(P)-dependent alcohol dehydrogenase [Streptomyces zingiberis]|uniref:NAD(P)-dependent alcohol dehydrogenase n=1 Tax=Streptomyces zingiberis TaxID=2053010 RepID=A0ABX1BZG6_9ACTN|nr:NAD(P)-dependent alcohol dehydrogenase [Streptomyces zingiberis]NJQ00714.1 NAD(P)-dependent alcohol dehydrogenase [Streptomyces zingiberis]